MRTKYLAILTGFTLATTLHGEPVATARTYIPTPLEVPAFVPPAPPVEKTVPVIDRVGPGNRALV